MKTIEIPAPVALPEEAVLVLNYRRKPAEWETGTVKAALFSPQYLVTRRDNTCFVVRESWSYDVWIDRPVTKGPYGRPRGGGYIISVRGDAIRKGKK